MSSIACAMGRMTAVHQSLRIDAVHCNVHLVALTVHLAHLLYTDQSRKMTCTSTVAVVPCSKMVPVSKKNVDFKGHHELITIFLIHRVFR